MMSKRAVAMRSERARVLRWGRRESFESGGVRERDGVKEVLGARVAVGSRKEVSTAETDLVRWKVGARCVARKEGVAKSFWAELVGRRRWKEGTYLDIDVPFRENVGS